LSLPDGTRRLFAAYAGENLALERAASLLIARLLEDGDAADLAWFLGETTETEIAAWFARHGGRQLSARSRAFWEVVLGVEAGPVPPEAVALWPL
jgi:hypothetical protein